MRTDEKKRKEASDEAYKRGMEDALHGVTYTQGSAAYTRDFLILAYARGYADGTRAKAGLK